LLVISIVAASPFRVIYIVFLSCSHEMDKMVPKVGTYMPFYTASYFRRMVQLYYFLKYTVKVT